MDQPHLRSISPGADPDEVAAIVAAVVELDRRRRAAAAGGREPDPQRLSHWRVAPRLGARRAGMTRGPWRLAGRLTRRTRG